MTLRLHMIHRKTINWIGMGVMNTKTNWLPPVNARESCRVQRMLEENYPPPFPHPSPSLFPILFFIVFRDRVGT